MKQIAARAIICFWIFILFLPVLAPAQDYAGPGKSMEMRVVGDFLANSDAPADWVALCRSISLLGQQKDPGSKELLVKILRQDKPVILTEGARLPGVMSPLDMLKAASLDALGKLNAREYMADMKEVYQKAGNNTLRNIARKNIKALGGTIEE